MHKEKLSMSRSLMTELCCSQFAPTFTFSKSILNRHLWVLDSSTRLTPETLHLNSLDLPHPDWYTMPINRLLICWLGVQSEPLRGVSCHAHQLLEELKRVISPPTRSSTPRLMYYAHKLLIDLLARSAEQALEGCLLSHPPAAWRTKARPGPWRWRS